MAMRPLLVIDNVPLFSFVQITMIEFSPLSCWVVRSPKLFIQHAPLMSLMNCCSMLIQQ